MGLNLLTLWIVLLISDLFEDRSLDSWSSTGLWSMWGQMTGSLPSSGFLSCGRDFWVFGLLSTLDSLWPPALIHYPGRVIKSFSMCPLFSSLESTDPLTSGYHNTSVSHYPCSSPLKDHHIILRRIKQRSVMSYL